MKDETFFTEDEYRLVLAALGREREVCEKLEASAADGCKILSKAMKSIEQKIEKLQYASIETTPAPQEKECRTFKLVAKLGPNWVDLKNLENGRINRYSKEYVCAEIKAGRMAVDGWGLTPDKKTLRLLASENIVL